MAIKLKNQCVAVVGLGVSGCAAVNFLLEQGAYVYAYDDSFLQIREKDEIKALLLKGLKIFEQPSNMLKEKIKLLVISPGIPKEHPFYLAAKENKMRIVGEAELAFHYLAEKECKCIGVTGTNGKTTVSFLLEHILKENGVVAKAVGNSGFPLTDLLRMPEEEIAKTTLIIELSSFQLDTIKSTLLDAAVLLNIKDDHLDRYASFQDYAKTKLKIFNVVKENGLCLIEERSYEAFQKSLSKKKMHVYGYGPTAYVTCDAKRIFYKGKLEALLPDSIKEKRTHNLENFMSAYGLLRHCGLSSKQIIDAFHTFKKPPHRLEFVRKLGHLTFIDDSKATNVDSVVRAVESLSGPIVLIAGGVDKGGSYAPWKIPFANKITKICTIGQAADKIKNELEHLFPIIHFASLESAVMHAAKEYSEPCTILLSPGCSSYDMFTSYVQRGECFKKIVNQLIE